MRALFRGKKTKTPTPQTVVASPKPQEPPLEDVLKQLDNYEVVILMDDSGSMASDGYWKDVRNSFLPTFTISDAILRIRQRML